MNRKNLKLLCVLLLLAVLFCSVFASCDNNGENDGPSNETQNSEEQSKTDEPQETTSSETQSTEPSEVPSQTEPTEPSESQSTEPSDTEPTEPSQTEPTEPSESQSTEPSDTEPTEPSQTEPTEPSESQSTEPSDTEPAEPSQTEPTEPVEPPVTEEFTDVNDIVLIFANQGSADIQISPSFENDVNSISLVNNTELERIGYNDTWSKVKYNEEIYYVSNKVIIEKSVIDGFVDIELTIKITAGAVNVRFAPGRLTDDPISIIFYDQIVEVVAFNGSIGEQGWYKIKLDYGDFEYGYISAHGDYSEIYVPSVDPSEPEITEPSETLSTEPSQTEPTEPSETQPTEPSQTEPTEPSETQPTEPSEECNHEYLGDCARICYICKETRDNKIPHTLEPCSSTFCIVCFEDVNPRECADNNGDGYCDMCNEKLECIHEYFGDCATVCYICKETRTSNTPHTVQPCNSTFCLICFEDITPTVCADNNRDGICDACGTQISPEPTEPNPTEPTDPQPTEPTEPNPTEPEECDHAISVWEINKHATCTENGAKREICSICGQTVNTGIIPATGHNYASNVTIADCTNEGVITNTCKHCGDVQTESIPALGHNLITIPGFEATCVNEGLADGKYCDRCGHVEILPELIEKLPHTPVTVPGKSATCMWEGLTDGSVCGVCDTIITEQTVIPIKDHVWTDSECIYCGKEEPTEPKPTEPSEPKPTEPTEPKPTEPTEPKPTEPSETQPTEPSDCAHENTETVSGKMPTCKADGMSDKIICNDCNNVIQDHMVIPSNPNAHTIVGMTEAKAPTCTSGGISAGERCKVCGKTFSSPTSLGKLPHKDDNSDGMCDYGCGNAVAPSLCEHAFDGGVITKAPTCTSDGILTYTCANCGEKKTEKLDLTGHDYSSQVTPPTCTDAGYTSYECSNCGNIYVDSFISANGHDIVILKEVSVTCTNDGLTEGKMCSVCGEVLIPQIVVPTIGHIEDFGTVTILPTCISEGEEIYSCTVCGEELRREILGAEGHEYDDGVITVRPSCIGNGEKVYTCYLCGDKITEVIVAGSANGEHSYVLSDRVYPTLSVDGYSTYVCSGCGETKTGNYLKYEDIVPNAYASSNREFYLNTPVFGIDVSYYQNDRYNKTPIPWDKVKAAGVDFVIIRAAYGTGMVDPCFEMNYQGAKAAGLDVGVYLYSLATTPEMARAEARMLKGMLQGKQLEYPVYLDLEDERQKALGKEVMKQLINAFIEEMQADGWFTSLYIYESFLKNYLDTNYTIQTYDIWYARYLTSYYDLNMNTQTNKVSWNFSGYQGPFGMWQFVSSAHINGFASGSTLRDLDANICYKDYPAIMKKYGFNGYNAEGDIVDGNIPDGKPEDNLDPSKTYIKVTANSLNVRSAPNFAANNVIGIAYKGDIYEVLEKNSGYTKISYNGQVAYVTASTTYIQFIS